MHIINRALAACALASFVVGTGAAAQPQGAGALLLRGGTEVPMKTVADLSSKTNRQGDRFDLVVADDIRVNGVTVIPRGSRGVGEISRLVHRGAFGKSGKLDTRVLYVNVGNQQVKLDGQTADKGKSGTAATVAVAVAAGVFSAFVTGKSARVPAGSTIVGYVQSDTPMLGAAAPAAVLVPASAPAQPH